MRANIAGYCVAAWLMIVGVSIPAPDAVGDGQEQATGHATSDAAARLEAALALAVRLPATPWKATFVETTVHRCEGKPDIVSDTESGTIVGSTRGFLIDKQVSPNGAAGSLAVLQGPSMHRSARGFAVYPSPPPFLCNLASVAPTVESLREAGLVTRDLWGKVSSRTEAARTVFEIAMSPRPGVPREEYVLSFEGAERSGRLSGFAWRIWRSPERGGELVLDSEIKAEVEGWVKLGDADVPSRVTRSVYSVYPGEPNPPRIVQRIELSPAGVSAEEAESALKAASTPLRGEVVRDYARSAEYRIGEPWIRVGGVEFELKSPVEGIPSSIPDLIKGAKAKATSK